MKTHFYTYQILSIFLFAGFLACTKEDPVLVEEQELITTVALTFSREGAPNETIRWTSDLDQSPLIGLKSNTQYTVSVSFLDESDPGAVENITNEVKKEADEHQIFYEFSGVAIEFKQAPSDVLDSYQNPLYVNTLWSTSNSGSGVVRVYLIHEPIQKTGSARSDFGGETDIAVDFTLQIEN